MCRFACLQEVNHPFVSSAGVLLLPDSYRCYFADLNLVFRTTALHQRVIPGRWDIRWRRRLSYQLQELQPDIGEGTGDA